MIFSPNAGFRNYAEKLFGKVYQTTNFDPKDDTDFHFDITQMDMADCRFDMILCYHVLEHIPADVQAMRELFRVLKPGGCCYIQTPFKEGRFMKMPPLFTPEDKLKHFEQEDHVRIYSVEGLADRLKNTGFLVDVLHYQSSDKPEEAKKYGFKRRRVYCLRYKTVLSYLFGYLAPFPADRKFMNRRMAPVLPAGSSLKNAREV